MGYGFVNRYVKSVVKMLQMVEYMAKMVVLYVSLAGTFLLKKKGSIFGKMEMKHD
jgi:hypothetical protein